jgi:hypothetical protein
LPSFLGPKASARDIIQSSFYLFNQICLSSLFVDLI